MFTGLVEVPDCHTRPMVIPIPMIAASMSAAKIPTLSDLSNIPSLSSDENDISRWAGLINSVNYYSPIHATSPSIKPENYCLKQLT